jgi:hypothetical protein
VELALLAMPYFVFLEFLGPVVETIGVALTIAGFILGDLSGASFLGFLVLAFLGAILLSVAALALEEFNFRRHQRTRDIVALVFYTLLENLGYRQLNDLVADDRVRGPGAAQAGLGRPEAARDRQPLGPRGAAAPAADEESVKICPSVGLTGVRAWHASRQR